MTTDFAVTVDGPMAGHRDHTEIPEGIPMGPGSPSARRYENRVCVVTCAGSGIDRAIALRLAAEGGMVIAADVDAYAAAQTVAMAGSGRAAEVDVRSEESVGWMAELVPLQETFARATTRRSRSS